MNERQIRALGLTTTVGGVTWGLSWIISPSTISVNSQPEIVASLAFQVGVLALLTIMWVTEATGSSRMARTVLASECVAVVLAAGWTVPYLVDPDRAPTMLLQVLDMFWPISMLGTLVVGIMVVRSRRWPTPLRYLPVAASLLLLVDVSVLGAPDPVRSAVTGVYLITSYGVLGVALVARAPRLAALSRHEPAHEGQVITTTPGTAPPRRPAAPLPRLPRRHP